MHELLYLGLFAAVVLALGVFEHFRIKQRIKKIPTRILVNGIRGKSTVTRLIAGILKEDGRKVAGKTTGTSARMFYWDQDDEEPIVRGLQGPNISEQKHMARKVVNRGADAFVSECMAVNPEYQKVFQERLVEANITVIANVIEDHLDVMGPTLDDIAEAFSSTIPHNGYLVIPETDYRRFFERIAQKRNTEVIVADESAVDEEYLKKFPFMIFPQNAALALAVSEALGIEREVALRGMLTAPVDPGAMRVHRFGEPAAPKYFFNGFAANDATSTLSIWDRVKELDYPMDNGTIVMNCREDRMDRTLQFIYDVLPHFDAKRLVLIGRGVTPIMQAHKEGKLPFEEIVNLEKQPVDEVLAKLQELPGDSVFYGIGNIKGAGEELAAAIEDIRLVDEERLEDYRLETEDDLDETREFVPRRERKRQPSALSSSPSKMIQTPLK
ncbi:poly-gamma-glutamate synthase PgsB [Alteribacter natronophilus]|uniref:poly-gamma-glutamate synthase PgsB n=1 Tax=Alteribacter natronophilus TaxID=2583810 RepID=UPI00110E0E12|nr:poly-gamma-glutamate synthase PgsB [Alteribacter natronophilus]TMW72228.1 poly-gamma-glutamate synthase PgsB [Alteribacter natronophilus]